MQLIKSKYYLLLLVLTLIVLMSCTNALEKQALVTYIQNEDNGLVKQKKLNGVDIKLQYKPSELIALRLANNTTNQDSIAKLIDFYKDYQYYILSYYNENGDLLNQYAQNPQVFGALVNELSFNMQQNAMIIDNKRDTTYLYDAIFSRMYNMSTSTDVMLVFKNPLKKDIKYYDLFVRDFGFRVGHTTFRFYKDDLEQIPNLKY